MEPLACVEEERNMCTDDLVGGSYEERMVVREPVVTPMVALWFGLLACAVR